MEYEDLDDEGEATKETVSVWSKQVAHRGQGCCDTWRTGLGLL